MKVPEIRDMSIDQLKGKLVDLKREQFNLRVQKATGQLEDTAQQRRIRRDIARVSTIMTERKGADKAA